MAERCNPVTERPANAVLPALVAARATVVSGRAECGILGGFIALVLQHAPGRLAAAIEDAPTAPRQTPLQQKSQKIA